jgi:hypothetical protein
LKTKKDFWRLIGISYLLIFSGILLLYFTEENSELEIYQLVAVILLEITGLIVIRKALKVFRSLEDKSVYPKQLDFLNKIAVKLYSEKKKSNLVFGIAIFVGVLIGVLSVLYKDGVLF